MLLGVFFFSTLPHELCCSCQATEEQQQSDCGPTCLQPVPGIPKSNAVAMEILLPRTVNFKVHMHLPVLQVTRLWSTNTRQRLLLAELVSRKQSTNTVNAERCGARSSRTRAPLHKDDSKAGTQVRSQSLCSPQCSRWTPVCFSHQG